MIIKCKMCGGDLHPEEGSTTCECEFCGTLQTIPSDDSEKKTNLFNRANRLRMNAEFDKAAAVYESIAAEFPEEAEAYWGLCLCAYGIEYVDDPGTGERKPTCHRTLPTSIMEDPNFEQACDNADPIARRVYREEAKAIDRIQKEILSIVLSEEPYDVFICYKETAEEGGRTEDSVLAEEIYDALNNKGLKVFFARITLEDKLGQQYEPYIYAALSSAKVMLAIGTKFEYYDAVWVKNEWMRFLSMMKTQKDKTLIPCYKDLDAYDMPKEFKNLQAQDMGKLGWLQDLSRGIIKLCGKADRINSTVPVSASPTVQSLLDRGFILLKDEKWDEALDQFNNVLNIDPKNAKAYLGLLLYDMRYSDTSDLERAFAEGTMEYNTNYEHIKEFDRGECKELLIKLANYQKSKIEKKQEKKGKTDDLIASGISSINYSHNFTFGLKSNGTVVATEYKGQTNNPEFDKRQHELYEKVIQWKDITSIVFCNDALFGLKKNGSVVVEGVNQEIKYAVSQWTDVGSLYASGIHVVALRTDGSVYATYAYDDPLDFDDSAYVHGEIETIRKWKNISKIFVPNFDSSDTVGVKNDGTLVYAGIDNDQAKKIGSWKNIVFVSMGLNHVVALENDGSVHACGCNEYGECDIEKWRNILDIAIGDYHTVGLKIDGTVMAAGSNDHGQCNVSNWQDIVSIYANGYVTYGIKADGTVLCTEDALSWKHVIALPYISRSHIVGILENGFVTAIGDNKNGECEVDGWRLFSNIATLEAESKDIDSKVNENDLTIPFSNGTESRKPTEKDARLDDIITIWHNRIIGVKADGTVLVQGSDMYNVNDIIRSWTGVVSIISSLDYVVALKYDGTVVSVVVNNDDEEEEDQPDTSKWNNITSIKAGLSHIVGLKDDGTVVATGCNDQLQCEITDWHDITSIHTTNYATFGIKKDGTIVTTDYDNFPEVGFWRNIVSLSTSGEHIVGLMDDGTVVADGNNKKHQCEVTNWSGIIQVSAEDEHTLGLKANGQVVAVGSKDYNKCNTTKWSGIIEVLAGYNKSFGITFDGKVNVVGNGAPGSLNVQNWTDIVKVYSDAGNTVGLKSDGTVLAVGNIQGYQCDLQEWKLFKNIDSLREEREKTRMKYIAGKLDISSNTNSLQDSNDSCAVLHKEQTQQAKGIELSASQETAEEKRIVEDQKDVEQMREDARNKLESKRTKVLNELSHLRGLFTGKRRRELESQLREINEKIQQL